MSKPTNYTPIDAVKVLRKELEKLFEGKTFSGQGGNKQLKFFEFEFPDDNGRRCPIRACESSRVEHRHRRAGND